MALVISTVVLAADGITVTCTTTGGAPLTSVIIPADSSNYIKGLNYFTDKIQFVAGSAVITGASTFTARLDVGTYGYPLNGNLLRCFLAAGVATDGTLSSGALNNKLVTNNSAFVGPIYVNNTSGGTAGGGRLRTNPMDSLGTLAQFVADETAPSGMIVYNTGHYRGSFGMVWNNGTLTNDPLAPVLYTRTEVLPNGAIVSDPIYWTVRGDQAGINMTNVATTEVYFYALAAEPNFAAENLDPTAANPKGLYVKVAMNASYLTDILASAALTARGQWGWTTTGGVAKLYCRGWTGQDLSTGATVTYGVDAGGSGDGTTSGGLIISGSNPTVSGGAALCWPGDTLSTSVEQTIAFYVYACTGTITIRGCHAYLGGNHAFSAAGANTGTLSVTGCIWDTCRSAPGNDTATTTVAYTNSAGAVLDSNFTNCASLGRPPLRADGTPLIQTTRGGRINSDFNVDGFFCHSNTLDKLNSCILTNCVHICYMVDMGALYDCGGTGFGNGTNMRGATTASDPTTYGHQIIGCELRSPGATQNNRVKPHAWIRSRISNGKSAPKATKVSPVTAPFYMGTDSHETSFAADACVFEWDTSPANTDFTAVMRFSASVTNAYLRECTIRQQGSTNDLDAVFEVNVPASTVVTASGCIFSTGKSTGLLAYEQSVGADQFVAANWVFTDNAHDGFSTYLYGAAAYDTQAEYQAAIDTNGVYGVAPGFVSTTSGSLNLALTPSSALRRRRKRLTNHATAGFNGLGYAGNHGGNQYPDGGGIRSRPAGPRAIRARAG